MTGWTRQADVRAALVREWDRGRLLAARVPAAAGADCGGGPRAAGVRETDGVPDGDRLPGARRATEFPFRVPLRRPRSREVIERFDEVRQWAADVTALPHGRVEFATAGNRVLGSQTLPTAVVFDEPAQALALIGKTRAAARFDHLRDLTPQRFHPALAADPLRVLQAAADWPAIVATAEWIIDHPTPDCYLREVAIPGVHGKVLEQHRRLIAALVDQVRPVAGASGGRHWFEHRYGFRTKPMLIRFRQLDPDTAPLPGLTDVTLTSTEFATLDSAGIDRVFVTENEINFLTFPMLPGALVIFGSGNEAPELLGHIGWLQRLSLTYWGDIDTHGFAILDRFRSRLPGTRSMLMDTETLLAHRDAWGTEPTQMARDLPHLTDSEAAVYGALLSGEHGDRVRLEQEFIGFDRVQRAVAEQCR